VTSFAINMHLKLLSFLSFTCQAPSQHPSENENRGILASSKPKKIL
jgi:hypothetical protein